MTNSKKDTGWQPDYKHWALFAAWTYEQAAALSLDIDPEMAQAAELSGTLLALYKKRLDVVNSHRYLSEWFPKSGCVEPHLFVAWATNYGLKLPVGLTEEVGTVHGKDEEWRQIWKQFSEIKRRDRRIAELEAENTELKHELGPAYRETRTLVPKAQISLLKLVLGMAIDKYHYKPNSGNSSAPGRIAASLDKCGIKLTVETVLGWLRAAADQIEVETPD